MKKEKNNEYEMLMLFAATVAKGEDISFYEAFKVSADFKKIQAVPYIKVIDNRLYTLHDGEPLKDKCQYKIAVVKGIMNQYNATYDEASQSFTTEENLVFPVSVVVPVFEIAELPELQDFGVHHVLLDRYRRVSLQAFFDEVSFQKVRNQQELDIQLVEQGKYLAGYIHQGIVKINDVTYDEESDRFITPDGIKYVEAVKIIKIIEQLEKVC